MVCEEESVFLFLSSILKKNGNASPCLQNVPNILLLRNHIQFDETELFAAMTPD